MTDRNFLAWIHARMTNVHNESELADYMHRLRAIIKATPVDKLTPSCDTKNSLEELFRGGGGNMKCTICHIAKAITIVWTEECPDGISACKVCADRLKKVHAETERIKEERT